MKQPLKINISYTFISTSVKLDNLMDKMYYYVIRGCVNDWFSSYLSRRQFTVLTIILPQPNQNRSIARQYAGSFDILPTPVTHLTPYLYTILFADDSTFYIIEDQPTKIINRANDELLKL